MAYGTPGRDPLDLLLGEMDWYTELHRLLYEEYDDTIEYYRR